MPEIARYCGRIYAKIKKIITNFKNDFEENKKELGFDDIKQEFDLAVSQEEINDEEKNQNEIIDIYGNVHKVSNLDKIRSDLSKEEIEAEIMKYNQQNKDSSQKE